MKRLLLLLLFIPYFTTLSQENWHFQNPRPHGNNVISIFFSDSLNGWKGGGSLGSIWHTSDAGVSWNKQYHYPSDTAYVRIGNIFFYDNLSGAAGGYILDQYSNYTPILMITNDGGNTWSESTPVSAQYSISDVHFSAQNTVFATSGSTIFRSVDAGLNWQVVYDGFNDGLISIDTYNADTILVAGSRAGSILTMRSIDGGDTWSTLNVGIAGTIYDTEYLNSDTLWSVVNSTVKFSTNGGTTWQGFFPQIDDVNDIFFYDQNLGWIACDSELWRTQDGGLTWNTVPTPPSSDDIYNQLFFTSPANGYVAGSLVDYKTWDGGATWASNHVNVLTTGIYTTLKKGFFLDSIEGWCVGDSGTVLHTINGGQDWLYQSSGTDDLLRDVWFANADTGYVIGRLGNFLKTVDGGNIWNIIPNTPQAQYTSMYWVDVDTGYVATTDGVIFKTLNGGFTWSTKLNNGIYALADIGFAGTQRGWAVSNTGHLFSTEDYGNSWLEVDTTSVNITYDQVIFKDPNNGLIIGDHILRTTDGGVSWNIVNADNEFTRVIWGPNQVLYGIIGNFFWTGSNNSENVIGISLDEGQSWSFLNTGLHNSALDIVSIDTSHIWTLGRYGQILKKGGCRINLNDSYTLCTGTSITLDAGSNFVSYNWNSGQGNSAQFTISTPGQYTIEATNSLGCVATKIIDVFESIPITLNLPNDTTICASQPLILASGYAGAQLWSDGSNSTSISVVESGTYTVVAGNQCGWVMDTVEIIADDTLQVDLGSNVEFCSGDSIVLQVGNYPYVMWSDGTTTPNNAIYNGGNIVVTIGNTCGFLSDSLLITELSLPQPDLPSDTVLCSGAVMDLEATPNYPYYDWSTSESTSTITVNSTGLYWVLVGNQCGATMDSVNVLPSTISVNLGSDFILAGANAATLDVGSNWESVVWSDGSTGDSIVIDSTVLQLGSNTVWVTVVDEYGCTASDTLVVEYQSVSSSDIGSHIPLNVYPNPSENGMLRVDFEGHIHSIKAIDITGRNVFNSVEIVGNVLNMSQLETGQYMIYFETSVGVIIREVSIVR